MVGQFVLEVEPCTAAPPDLLVWLQTVAGMTAGGPNMVDQWKERLDWQNTPEPFSFMYGETPSKEFFRNCRRTSQQKQLDEQRTAHTVVYVDPETGLEVRWEGVEYPSVQDGGMDAASQKHRNCGHAGHQQDPGIGLPAFTSQQQ